MTRATLRLLFSLLRRELESPGSVLIGPLLTAAAQVERRDGPELVTLGDRRIHRACALIHGDLARRWTVEELARSVSLSRAAFARLFPEVTGVSPGRYLTACRLECAAERLHTSEASLSEIAAEVGYDSEFAFGRAFKRYHGVSPGAYRKRLRSIPGGAITMRAA